MVKFEKTYKECAKVAKSRFIYVFLLSSPDLYGTMPSFVLKKGIEIF